ncbi:MAG: 4Fe-4S dicluster domain-containing protein [Synergistaceae bacterium]|nr:4Fe-4S dicluster domain-containing protein [Synergistaceae bacterium]MBR1418533.1 4Fe-4S dicluster domain-containing protein [Synergistaceae bacterium]MBR1602813.1 4Fe-4S dicluster domain-containing protein [Synergistaceae bacterium]
MLAVKKSFNVVVNSAWCKGCSLCIGVCPKNVLGLSERLKAEAVKQEDCIGCRQCENICPDLAVTVNENLNNQEAK